jgi:MFS family permease
MFFLGALYLQRVLGYDSLEVGLAFLPTTLVIGVLSLGFSQKLNLRFGAKATLVPSLVLIAGSLGLFAVAPVDGSYLVNILPPAILMGLGAGMAFPGLMMLAMSGATPEDAGLASGLVNTTMQVGGAIGLAVLATLATDRTRSLVGEGHGAAAALTGGYHLAFAVGVGLVAAALMVALTVVRAPEIAGVEQIGSADPAYSEAA